MLSHKGELISRFYSEIFDKGADPGRFISPHGTAVDSHKLYHTEQSDEGATPSPSTVTTP